MQSVSDTSSSNHLVENDLQKSLRTVDNSGLWKQALEEHGLNRALDQFHTVISQSKGNKNGQQGTSNNIDFKAIVAEKSKESVLENNKDMSSQPKKLASPVLNLPIKAATVGFANHQHIINNFGFSVDEVGLENVVNKTIKKTAFSPILLKSKWLDKHTLVTMVNSNVEVWVRDAVSQDVNLNQLRKVLNVIMPNINAKLVKVAINGKVVFNQSTQK